MARRVPEALLFATALVACGVHEPVPAFYAQDARFGRLAGAGDPPSTASICGHWTTTVFARDEWATTHVSFPETNVQDACFTTVVHRGREVSVGTPPRGCAYPNGEARSKIERVARELDELGDRHRLVRCALVDDRQRAASARHDASVLHALGRHEDTHPYSAIVIPGHGVPEKDRTPFVGWLPGDAGKTLSESDLRTLGAMPYRAARAADAWRGGVAPVIVVSGSAVHSKVVEAFALRHFPQCEGHVPTDRIVVEPCADHTHTNLRNGGRWVHAMGGRAAYLLTDDWVQAEYFQDLSAFNFILGSIDQRSTRSWGYLIGSWRQASVGTNAGFWFTPYRFWAEPRDGLGSLTCVNEGP